VCADPRQGRAGDEEARGLLGMSGSSRGAAAGGSRARPRGVSFTGTVFSSATLRPSTPAAVDAEGKK
jgi:hypothetical protein